MKNIFLFAKSSEDCNKFSKSVSYETLVGGTTTVGREYEQTQCLNKGRAGYRFCKTMSFSYENLVDYLLHCHPERSEGSSKTHFTDWILHFASAPFRMTIPSLILAVVLSFGYISESWAADAPTSGTCGEGCNWSYNTTTKELTLSGNGTMNDYRAASGGWDFGPGWKDYMSQIETVKVAPGSTLSNIGDLAFDGATSLLSVDMPNVKTIGRFAFSYASSLTSVDLPNVTTIGYGAFSDASSLTNVNMPNVSTIGIVAFSSTTSLRSISAPNINTIDDGAFQFSGLSFIDLPNSVVTMGEDVFRGTSISHCSSSNHSDCGSCSSNQYIMPGRGCVSECGTGFLSKNKRCIDDNNGCGNGYILEGKNCALDYEWLDDNTLMVFGDLPEITEDIFGLSTTLSENTKIICRGYVEKCRKVMAKYPLYYPGGSYGVDPYGYSSPIGGYYAPTDMSNLVIPATESNCESGSYYWSGTSCNNKKNGIKCEENFKQMETWCNRIRYTPADAAKVLKDTDNEIVMTFKVNR